VSQIPNLNSDLPFDRQEQFQIYLTAEVIVRQYDLRRAIRNSNFPDFGSRMSRPTCLGRRQPKFKTDLRNFTLDSLAYHRSGFRLVQMVRRILHRQRLTMLRR